MKPAQPACDRAASLALAAVERHSAIASADQHGAATEDSAHASIASDRRPDGAGHGPALDRPGHRRGEMADLELHDQPIAMGRLWRGTVRPRPGPDLAKQALNRQ